MTKYRFQVLNGNMLKIIALITMTIDHVGMICFPQDLTWRYIGRLAYPIFAYMIAEGCYYTRNKKKYVGLIFAIGVLCQIVAYVSEHTLYMCIMITFTMSVLIIFALQKAIPDMNRNDKTIPDRARQRDRINVGWCVITALAIGAAAFITLILPDILSDTDFTVDYGFFGVLLPVVVYVPNLFMKNKGAVCRLVQTLLMAIWLIPVWKTVNDIEWFALFSCILLLLYNGEKGRLNLKYLFYIYYPVHIGLIELIWMLCTGNFNL